jgi:MOSC domain-containing protein YiiM
MSMDTSNLDPRCSVSVLSLHVGQVRPLGPEGRPSAIGKEAVTDLRKITVLGLEGDAQADLQHHGGPDKALHHYPREHYAAWRAELPSLAALFVPGGFGENLSTQGLTEATVCLGDIFTLGSAVVQVSQGRKPCWKLNARFGVADMARRVQDSGRTGWYYRVLEEGDVAPGEPLTLVERPCPAWPLARLWRVLNQEPPDRAALAELVELEVLAPGWRETARKRLAGGGDDNLGQRLGKLLRG